MTPLHTNIPSILPLPIIIYTLLHQVTVLTLSQKRDIATATATFGFVRNLGSAISVVVGGVVFQNQMAAKEPLLQSSLGPQMASAFGGGSAGANVRLINTLPEPQKEVARQAFSDSLSTMWILYVCFAGAGLASSFLITKNILSKQHEETKTGMEAEREKRMEREAARNEKRKSKAASKDNLASGRVSRDLTADVEKGSREADALAESSEKL